MTNILPSTREQTDACATAFVDACLGAIRTGVPHNIAYTKSDHHFSAYQVGQQIRNDANHPAITRDEALAVATTFKLNPLSPDFEQQFRDKVFMDHVNRNPRETLASDFLSGLCPKSDAER